MELLLLILRYLFGRVPKPVLVPSQPKTPAQPEPGAAAPTWGDAQFLVDAMLQKGYRVYDGGDTNSHNLNIVGVRNTKAKVDEFGCKLYVFWRHQGKTMLLAWDITTYPGSHYLITKLISARGAAILVPGQYPVYQLDTHNDKYRAVCQRTGPVRVYRDGDRDREFDLVPSSIQLGSFGINIHAPITPNSGNTQYVANLVGAASAGCQVFRRLADFLEFRSICEKAAELWGNSFTYTLLEDTDFAHKGAPVVITPTPHDALESWAPTGNTAGVRNKNLLNVKQGADPWMYSDGHKDERGHAIFPSYAKGLRAGIKLLRTYWLKYELNTVLKILGRWAPASDTVGSLPGMPRNSPVKYANFVSDWLGVGYNTPLQLFDASGNPKDLDQLYRLVSAMSAYENYATLALPREVFDEAVRLL